MSVMFRLLSGLAPKAFDVVMHSSCVFTTEYTEVGLRFQHYQVSLLQIHDGPYFHKVLFMNESVDQLGCHVLDSISM